MVNIGINGFGRIGRHVLRACIRKGLKTKKVTPTSQVVAINDPFLSPDHMAYLFRFDSTHGKWEGQISSSKCYLTVNDQQILVTNEKDPRKIPWNRSGAEYIVEATGIFTTCEKASMHLDGGAKRVLITAPSDAPMFVVGVNHSCYNNDMDVISMTSCTTNCLAPLIKVIHGHFGIFEGLFTSIHAVTASQRTVDAPSGKRWRDGRGGLQNIIPVATGAAKSIGKIFPDLEGRMTGFAMRVPVADVSALDLTVRLATSVDYVDLMCKIKEVSEGYLKGILGFTDHQVVSSDFIGDSRSCIVDAKAGIPLNPYFMKIVAWYDNEYSYACRICDMLDYMNSREDCPC